jgi:hypothetical protein
MQTQERNYFAKDFFTYEVDFSALLAGSSQTQSFTIQADADFLLSKLAYSANIANAAYEDATRPIPNVSVLIQDTGSGRNLMNLAVPLASIFGTGQLPFILPRQRIFLANATVNVTLNNFDAATAYNCRLSFIGEKGFLA